MPPTIHIYNQSLSPSEQQICILLSDLINEQMGSEESKIWHGHPVWFIDGNPIVGYSKIKAGIKLMFWSGISFDEPGLLPGSGKFKDASILYTDIDEINDDDIKRWISKGKTIQWDYKNIVKRKGKLERLV